MTLTEIATESRIDRALTAARNQAPTHDVRDRRANNMQLMLDALGNCTADLNAFAGDRGIGLLIADRLAKITAELAGFRARDLLNMREAAAS